MDEDTVRFGTTTGLEVCGIVSIWDTTGPIAGDGVRIWGTGRLVGDIVRCGGTPGRLVGDM